MAGLASVRPRDSSLAAFVLDSVCIQLAKVQVLTLSHDHSSGRVHDKGHLSPTRSL